MNEPTRLPKSTAPVFLTAIPIVPGARLALAVDWLRTATVDLNIEWEPVWAEVERRRNTRGVTAHAAALEVLLDLRAGLWSRS